MTWRLRRRSHRGHIAPVLFCALALWPAILAAQSYIPLTTERRIALDSNRCLTIAAPVDSLVVLSLSGAVLHRQQEFGADRNLICLTESAGDSVRVLFWRRSPFLTRTFALRSYATTGEALHDAALPAAFVTGAATSEGNLKITGTKSFSADVSDRNSANLSQGLALTISGEIKKGVAVRGTFADRGTRDSRFVTRRFSELESVYLEVESSSLRSRFGSFALKREQFRFQRLSRQVQGLELSYASESGSSEIAAAAPRGNFVVNEFETIEGSFGPYRLRDRDGRFGVAVVENSEAVWYNGMMLQRGRDQDYYIDYLRGELIFTGRRLVNPADRVRIEFEAQRLEYRKTLLAAAHRHRLGETLSLAAGYTGLLTEASDPLDFSLTDSDRVVLAQAGDDPARALQDGARFVGSGNGSYIADTDSAGTRFYRHVGAGNGDLLVEFAAVDSGGYVYLGAGRYQFVGKKQGSYEPLRILPLPETSQQLGLLALWRSAGASTLSAELAMLNTDRNRLSSLDDGNNNQPAAAATWSLVSRDHRVSGSLSGELVPAEANRFGRTDRIDDNYLWQRESTAPRDRRLAEVQLRWSPDSAVSLGLNGGLVAETGGFRSQRVQGALNARPASWVDLSLTTSITGADERESAHRRLLRAIPRLALKALAVEFRSSGDFDLRRREQTGTSKQSDSKRDLDLSLGWNGLTIAAQVRQNWRKLTEWQRLDVKRTYTARLDSKWGSGRRVDLTMHQNSYRNQGRRERYQTGALSLLLPQLAQILSVTADYRLNRRGIAATSQTYLKVDPGDGDYVLIDSVYVAQPRGDYVLVNEDVGNLRASIEAEKRLLLESDLSRLAASPLLNGLSLRYEVSFREIGDTASRFPWEWLVPPRRYFGVDSRLRQQTSAYRAQRFDRQLRLNTELSYQRRRDDNRLEITTPGRRRSEEIRLLTQKTVGDRDLAQLMLNARNRSIDESPRQRLFLRERGAEFGYTHYSGAWELGISLRGMRERADSLEFDVRSLRVTPSIAYAVVNRGRIELSVFALQVSEAREQELIIQLAEGFPRGNNGGGRIRVDIAIADNFSLKIYGHGEIRAGERNRYFLRSELISKFQ